MDAAWLTALTGLIALLGGWAWKVYDNRVQAGQKKEDRMIELLEKQIAELEEKIRLMEGDGMAWLGQMHEAGLKPLPPRWRYLGVSDDTE